MTFVCTLTEDNSYVGHRTSGSSHMVRQTIGYDDEEEVIYSLFVSMAPAAGGELELIFCIVKTETIDGVDVDYDYWSGAETGFIPRQDRELVMLHLLNIIRNLIAIVKPRSIFMCTMDANAPIKANEKYGMILTLFELVGYQVHIVQPMHGRMMWRMELPDAADISSA